MERKSRGRQSLSRIEQFGRALRPQVNRERVGDARVWANPKTGVVLKARIWIVAFYLSALPLLAQETRTITIDCWEGTGCSFNDTDMACRPPELDTCSFHDPLPLGSVVTEIRGTVYGCDSFHVDVSWENALNGTLIGSSVDPGPDGITEGAATAGVEEVLGCDCSTVPFQSSNYPNGFPNYVYGGTNTFAFGNFSGFTYCVRDVSLTLTTRGVAFPCEGDAECDDSNPCTADTCEEGVCAFTGGTCVVAVDPADNFLGTFTDANVTLTYHDPIDPATVNAATYRLVGPDDVPVPAALSVSPSGTQAILDPSDALSPRTTYRVEATSGILGPGETPAQPFTSFFRTGVGSTELPVAGEPTAPLPPSSLGGTSIAAAGDLDGDGLADFVAGAPGYGDPAAGAALVYLGSTSAAERASPDIFFTGEAEHDRAGVSVAGDFDFNGDGHPDLVIGAEQVDQTGSPTGAGKVYLIFFDPSDTVHFPNLADPATPDVVSLSLVGQPGGIPGVVFTGIALGDRAGFSVDATMGPPAILIGAPGADLGASVDAGAAYVVFGSATLSGTISLSRISSGLPDQVPGKAYLGSQPGALVGFSVAFAGDVVLAPIPIGDPGGTVVLGAPGSNSGSGTVIVTPRDPDTTPIIVDNVGETEEGVRIDGTQEGEELGAAVADGKDAIGDGSDAFADGVPDLLLGAPGYDVGGLADAGRVLHTTAFLLSGVYAADAVGTQIPGVIWTGAAAGDGLGSAVAGLGDVTGDGLDDVALGAPFADVLVEGVTKLDAGIAYLIAGTSEGGLLGSRSVAGVGTSIAGQLFTGTEPGEHAGAALAGIGDVDGDGQADLGVGAPGLHNAAGAAYMVLDISTAPLAECGPAGCRVADLSNGAEIEVLPGALTGPVHIMVAGILDPAALPAPPPAGMTLLGAARFTPEDQVLRPPSATIWIPTSLARLAAGASAAGATFPLFAYDGTGWVPASITGAADPNPSYPTRTAVRATTSSLHVFAVFSADPCQTTNCDDGDCCTLDACDPATGCTHVAITTAPVFVQQPSLGTCAMLWPPTHGYADFSVNDTGAEASSACGISSVEFASCGSSQPENSSGAGDGNTTRDCVFEPDAVHLRAERDGSCSPVGRAYTMRLIATDVCGNRALSDPFEMGVWHDRGHAPVTGTVYAGHGGSGATRTGTNGSYNPGCGSGNPTCGEEGQAHDASDADPEMEIDQLVSISVDDLRLEKAAGGSVELTWTEPLPAASVHVTRFHVYRLDPETRSWTLIGEVGRQTTSFHDPIQSDGNDWQYKVTAMIK